MIGDADSCEKCGCHTHNVPIDRMMGGAYKLCNSCARDLEDYIRKWPTFDKWLEVSFRERVAMNKGDADAVVQYRRDMESMREEHSAKIKQWLTFSKPDAEDQELILKLGIQ